MPRRRRAPPLLRLKACPAWRGPDSQARIRLARPPIRDRRVIQSAIREHVEQQQPQADAISKTMLDNSTLAAFRTCRREQDFWRRRQTVESHSARLRGRRCCIESIEPAVQFTFRSRPCQYFSLSSRRSIFPVAVRGKASMNSTLLGALKAATRSRAQRITSWGSGLLPGFG